jgi:hypothetical protein
MKQRMLPGTGRHWPHVVIVVALLVAAAPLVAQTPADVDGWRLESRDHGVELYLRASDASPFPAVRAIGEVCAPIATLSDYLLDHTHFAEWIPDADRARLLQSPSVDERIFQLQLRMPWPLQDRDMVYRITRLGADATGDGVTVAMFGLPDYAPPAQNVVRIRRVEGAWHFAERGDRTRIDLTMQVDPGGKVKPWFANRRIAALVTGMLTNLARIYADECQS